MQQFHAPPSFDSPSSGEFQYLDPAMVVADFGRVGALVVDFDIFVFDSMMVELEFCILSVEITGVVSERISFSSTVSAVLL